MNQQRAHQYCTASGNGSDNARLLSNHRYNRQVHMRELAFQNVPRWPGTPVAGSGGRRDKWLVA
jgi:hypothetical protein